MKIYLSEIKETDTELDFTDSDAWVSDSVLALDEDRASVPGSPEALRPKANRAAPAKRPVRVHMNLRRVDDVIVVSGDISASIQLLCSRCAAPFLFPIDEHFTALYCKDKEMAGISYLDKDSNPRGQNKGHARHAHDFDAPKGDEASEDLEITYIAEEYLDLPLVLSEQIRLRIPFQPLCKEDCKGVCSNCGADWNVGRCACSKIMTKSPFAALKNIKI
jgi:uncharacterized protein